MKGISFQDLLRDNFKDKEFRQLWRDQIESDTDLSNNEKTKRLNAMDEIEKEYALAESKNNKKRKSKASLSRDGLHPIRSVNQDAGNVEAGISFFNATSGGMSEDVKNNENTEMIIANTYRIIF